MKHSATYYVADASYGTRYALDLWNGRWHLYVGTKKIAAVIHDSILEDLKTKEKS